MTAYDRIIFVHALFGAPALVTFWIAALARKGSEVHRMAGKVFLLSMAGILLTTLPIIRFRAMQGRIIDVVFLSYLFLIVLTAIALTWRSIRGKRDFTRYTSLVFRGLGAAMLLSGLAILVLSSSAPTLARGTFMAGLSMVGIVTGSSMWMLIRQGPAHSRWWLAQHMNGAALGFAATHASFLGLGLRSAIPALGTPWMHTSTQLFVVGLALVLRLWFGPGYLRGTRRVQTRVAAVGQPQAAPPVAVSR